MKRRNFLARSGLFLTSACLPVTNLWAEKSNSGVIWKELVDYARWCPSPHNVQPWKLKIISDTEAHLYYEPKRTPIVVDETTAFTSAGMGMFIECLSIAAFQKGLDVIETHDGHDRMYADRQGYQLFATLNLAPTSKNTELDPGLIMDRKTSRMPYDDKLVPADLVERLKAVAQQYGYKFHYSSDKELIDYTINLNNETILERSMHKPTSEEMSEWIRVTDEQARKSKDGLWYKCMGVSGRLFYNFFHHPERYFKRRKLVTKKLTRQVKGTRNLAWISGPFDTKSDWIRAGALLQRMWLEITKDKVYLLPFGAVATYKSALVQFQDRINYDHADGELWFILRMGFGDEPPRSLRLDTRDILI